MKEKTSEKYTLLAVDDENSNLDILKRFLKDDYQLYTFTSGHEALKKAFSGEPIDMFLLDIMMPQIDGFEIAKKLKENDLTCDIPIIFLTGQMDPENIRTGFELGGQDYITKPYHLLELKARVATHLKLTKQQEELASVNQKLEQMVAVRTEALQHSLDEKEALILELTHRVKNILQMSISLLQLRLQNIEHTDTKLAMRDFLCSMQNISLAHNLAQNEDDLLKIPMNNFLSQLITLVKQRFADFNQELIFKTNFDTSFLHINSVIPLGLLTIEIFSSTLGLRPLMRSPLTIDLNFQQDKKSNYILDIKFNKLKIFDNETERLTERLKLAYLLARQLHGELNLDVSKAFFYLTFKEPELKTYNPYVKKSKAAK
ncbi:response regulator [bacterium]